GLTYEMVSTGSATVMSVATNSYDLVLLDVMISDVDGIETTRRIRGMHEPSAELPIVALVAHSKRQYCGAYLAAGMDACVTKPISAGELHAALRAVSHAGAAARAHAAAGKGLHRRSRLEIIDQDAREQDQISDQQQAERIGREERQRHNHADDDQDGDDYGDE